MAEFPLRVTKIKCFPGSADYDVAEFLKALECPGCQITDESHTQICRKVNLQCCLDCLNPNCKYCLKNYKVSVIAGNIRYKVHQQKFFPIYSQLRDRHNKVVLCVTNKMYCCSGCDRHDDCHKTKQYLNCCKTCVEPLCNTCNKIKLIIVQIKKFGYDSIPVFQTLISDFEVRSQRLDQNCIKQIIFMSSI